MHLEDLLAPLNVRAVERNLPIEAAGAEQSLVQNIRPIGARQNHHSGRCRKPIHLDQQLVQGVLALIVGTRKLVLPARTANGVDLVDEDDARRVLLRLLEEVAHAGRAHADEHLHELGPGDREEGNSGLSGDGFGEEGLTGSRGAYEEYSLGDLGTDSSELLGALEELDDLLELSLSLVHTGNVGELDPGVGLHLELSLGLAESHGVAGAALATHATHTTPTALLVATGEEEEPADQQQRESKVAQEVQEDLATILLLAVSGEVDVLRAELLQQLRAGAGQLHAHALHAVPELGAHGLNHSDGAVLVQVYLLHAVHVQVLQEARVGHPRGGDVRIGGHGSGGGHGNEGRAHHVTEHVAAGVAVDRLESGRHFQLVLAPKLACGSDHRGAGQLGVLA
mmetsp:Transcript_3731/g.6369  ORF Transcript_3731/g.6369 Transcript_3731/m.6369 type:complete len:396 (+) Transcript_3731:1324-2511(+)